MPPNTRLALSIDADALRALVAQVVAETVAALRADEARLPDHRLAFSEAEAAELLGLRQHQLRDARQEGKITASIITGRRIRYERSDLLRYLQQTRTTEGGGE